MDIFKQVADHIRTLGLDTPRTTSAGRQIIQEDNPPQDNSRDVALQGVSTGRAQQDLGRNRSIPMMIQVTIKNMNQKQAFEDAWKIADSFDKLPRMENKKWVTLESGDGSFLFENSETYTQPRGLGQTEHGAYVYVLTLLLNIEK